MIVEPETVTLLLGVGALFVAWFTVMDAYRFVSDHEMKRHKMEPGIVYLARVPLTMWFTGLVVLTRGVVKMILWLFAPPLSRNDSREDLR